MNKVKYAILAMAMVVAAGCSNVTFALRSVIHQANYDGGEKGRITARPADSGSNRVEAPKETNLNDSGKVSLTGK